MKSILLTLALAIPVCAQTTPSPNIDRLSDLIERLQDTPVQLPTQPPNQTPDREDLERLILFLKVLGDSNGNGNGAVIQPLPTPTPPIYENGDHEDLLKLVVLLKMLSCQDQPAHGLDDEGLALLLQAIEEQRRENANDFMQLLMFLSELHRQPAQPQCNGQQHYLLRHYGPIQRVFGAPEYTLQPLR